MQVPSIGRIVIYRAARGAIIAAVRPDGVLDLWLPLPGGGHAEVRDVQREEWRFR